MNNFLSRSEVDKLLGIDPSKRTIKPYEAKQLHEALEKAKEEKGAEISDDELDEILERLNLKDIAIRRDIENMK